MDITSLKKRAIKTAVFWNVNAMLARSCRAAKWENRGKQRLSKIFFNYNFYNK
jgi:hypothetical protein